MSAPLTEIEAQFLTSLSPWPGRAGRVRLLGVAGSLRRDAFSRRLLRAAADLAPKGVDVDLDADLRSVPPFDEDDEASPERAVRAWSARIRAADGVLIVTPEYNGSVPGQLKNAIDWASRPRDAAVLAGVPVAVLSASPSPRGGATARDDARRILARAGARVLDIGFPVSSVHERFDGDKLVDDELAACLRAMMVEIAGALDATVNRLAPA